MLRNEISKSTRDDIVKELTEVFVLISNLASIPTIPDRIQPIISEFNVLFDISSCKCLIQEVKCFFAISLLRELPESDHEVICDVMQRNGSRTFTSHMRTSHLRTMFVIHSCVHHTCVQRIYN